MRKFILLSVIGLGLITTISCKKEEVAPNPQQNVSTPQQVNTPAELNGNWTVLETEVMTISGIDTTRTLTQFKDSLNKTVVNVYSESYKSRNSLSGIHNLQHPRNILCAVCARHF